MTYKFRPLFLICILVVMGIIFQDICRLDFWNLFAVAASCWVLSIFILKWRFMSSLTLGISILLASAIYTNNCQKFEKTHFYYTLRHMNTDAVLLEGIVISDTIKKKSYYGHKTTWYLSVHKMKKKQAWRKATGKLMVHYYGKTDVSYGDYVRLKGKISYPFNFSDNKNFSYRKYLNRRGIYRIMHVKKADKITVMKSSQGHFLKEYCYKLRSRLRRILKAYLSESEAGIMQAILIGERAFVPERIRELFSHTGTAHILAISGLHVGIVGAFFLLMLRIFPVPLKGQYILTIFLVIFYCLLTGARPSVVRASIMFSLYLLGFLIEKESDGINALSLAALIILMINPMSLYDIGFQLSFLSVIFILSFFQKISIMISAIFQKLELSSLQFLSHSIAVSLSAWAGVAGLIAFYFGVITPISIIANLIIIPLITLIVLLGVSLLLLGGISPLLAEPFAVCLSLMLNIMVGIAYLLEKLPMSYISVQNVSLWQVSTYYIFGMIMMIFSALCSKNPYNCYTLGKTEGKMNREVRGIDKLS